MTALTPEQWGALNLQAQITSVTIASPPVVNFKVTDSAGKPVVGLEAFTSKSATATAAGYSNVAFTIAKLVPGTAKSPDQWVNYIVTTVPSTTAAAAPARPSTDNTGTLVSNGDGTYKYTFYRDITTIKQQIDGMTVTGADNRKEDLGDLTYAPNLQHRVVMQLSGAARGTGRNTPTGADSGIAAVNLKAVNAFYDFVPATGATIASADQAKYIVDISSCNACHDRLAFHGGGARVDTKFCTTCHTTQRAYGRAKVDSTNLAFPAVSETKTVDSVTGKTTYGYTPSNYVGDGEVFGNFTTMVHKIHNGHTLVKSNYNYAGVPFDRIGFSMLDNGQRMCTVCHDTAVAPKADLAFAKPSRQACGACHDGINWATGAGTTINGSTGGHIGRAQADDSLCDACHQAATTRVDHRTVNLTKHNPAVTDGLANFTYEIKEAKVDPATNNLTIEFRILRAIAPSTTKAPVTFVAPAATVANPLDGFTGGPSFLLAFAAPQIDNANPVDYNNAGSGQSNAQPRSVSIANLLSTSNAANGKIEPAATAGYYVATIYGTGAWAMPAAAKMRTVALQGYFTQVSPAEARHTISTVKTVTGDTARRKVVDATKCGNCHEWFEAHGGNRVIGAETGSGELVCMACHVPNMTSSGHTMLDAVWNMKSAGGGGPVPGSPSTVTAWTSSQLFMFGEWGVDPAVTTNGALQLPVTSNNMKDMIHGIHAGHDRVDPWKDARNFRNNQTMLDFRRMGFPGNLDNCQTCHNAGTYSSVPANALVTNNKFANDVSTPAAAAASMAAVSTSDVVRTPFGAACASCHDTSFAKAHMTQNGARLDVARGTVGVVSEACQVCHGPGAEWDAAKVHK